MQSVRGTLGRFVLLLGAISIFAATLGQNLESDKYNLRYVGALSLYGDSSAYDVNDLNVVVGEASSSGNPLQPFYWSVENSVTGPRSLPVAFPSTGGAAFGIDNQGRIAGITRLNSSTAPTYWTPSGQTYNQNTIPVSGSLGQARGIDEADHVVGWQGASEEFNLAGLNRAFIYTISTGTITLLAAPGGYDASMAYSVATNTSGTTYVAGTVRNSSTLTWRACRWTVTSGSQSCELLKMERLDTLGNQPPAVGQGVNTAGTTVGYLIPQQGAFRGWVWRTGDAVLGGGGTGARDLGSLTGFISDSTLAYAINNNGRIVGESDGGSNVRRPFFVDLDINNLPGQIYELNKTHGSDADLGYSSGSMRAAYGLNSMGGQGSTSNIPTIAGRGIGTVGNYSGKSQAYVARAFASSNGQEGRAIGGVSTGGLTNGELESGLAFTLGIKSTYAVPGGLGTFANDYRGDDIIGSISFFRTNEQNQVVQVALGGVTSINQVAIRPGQYETVPQIPLTTVRADAGKSVRMISALQKAYYDPANTQDSFVHIKPLTSVLTLPSGLSFKLGTQFSATVHMKASQDNLGIDGATLTAKLRNDTDPNNAKQISLTVTPQGNGDYQVTGLIDPSLGVGPAVKLQVIAQGRLTGDVFPYWTERADEIGVRIFADATVSVASFIAAAGDQIDLMATLQQTANNAPVAGRMLQFYVDNSPIGVPVMTDASGLAIVPYTVPAIPPIILRSIKVHFDGDGVNGLYPDAVDGFGTLNVKLVGQDWIVPNHVLGVAAAWQDQSGKWTQTYPSVPLPFGTAMLLGTFGETIIGQPDSESGVPGTLFNGFLRTIVPTPPEKAPIDGSSGGNPAMVQTRPGRGGK